MTTPRTVVVIADYCLKAKQRRQNTGLGKKEVRGAKNETR